MKRPRALDLFCGAGGASQGLAQAGFDVTCVDIHYQQNHIYECPGLPNGSFVKADALTFPLKGYDFIWASPPCQAYTPLNAYNKKTYPDLVDPIRKRLKRSGIPYVIENVVQAPLIDPIILCGSMFGLRVYRHRGFESSFPLKAPEHPKHTARCARNGYLPKDDQFMTITGGRHSIAWRERAAKEMGVPWMKEIREVCEAIPPAYAKYIGEEFLK